MLCSSGGWKCLHWDLCCTCLEADMGTSWQLTLIASPGIPSSPGAFLFCRKLTAVTSSLSVKLGIAPISRALFPSLFSDRWRIVLSYFIHYFHINRPHCCLALELRDKPCSDWYYYRVASLLACVLPILMILQVILLLFVPCILRYRHYFHRDAIASVHKKAKWLPFHIFF